MNAQLLREEIERRIAEKLPAALFERGLVVHAKHSFRRGCNCDFCIIKRTATDHIGRANRNGSCRPCYATTEVYESLMERKRQVRKQLRLVYKAKMNDALAGI